MKKTLLALALLALVTPAAQADSGKGCIAQSTDPFLGLSVQQSSVKSITCTLNCPSGAVFTCSATTCGEFVNGVGQRCLRCDGVTKGCCPQDPVCVQECLDSLEICQSQCRTRTCLAECQDSYFICRQFC
jgi:hypothetical protein